MTATRFKKGLFVILLAVAANIWWGNIQSFREAPPEEMFQSITPIQSVSRDPTGASLSYLPPKVNPFRRYPSPTVSSSQATNPPPVVRPPLHSAYKLQGIVGKGNLAQAIVQLPDRSTRILSTGDSLESWQLKDIRDLYVTFLNGKRHDTLFLDTKGL